MKKKKIAALGLVLLLIVWSIIAQGETSAPRTFSLNMAEQVSEWKTGSKNGADYVYALKVMYCENPVIGAKQCLNIYVPAAYMN